MMHNSLSWSNSAHQRNSSARSASTSFQRPSTSHRTDCTVDYMNTSMEAMDWSDTCFDVSNNSLMSPATFRVQSSHLSGSWKTKENTSPSSLLSSLNITDFSRLQDTTQPFMSQTFVTSSKHLSAFQPSQSMPQLSASNLSLAKSKLPLAVSNLSSASLMLPMMKPNLPFPTSLVSTSQSTLTPLPAFQRTFQNSSRFLKKSPVLDGGVIRPAFDPDVIMSALHEDQVPGASGNISVMKNEEESFLQNEIAEETDLTGKVLAEERNTLKNKLSNVNLRKPRRSTCSCLFRISCYALLAVLVMLSAMLVASSYFQSPDCDTRINVSLVRQALSENVFGQHIAVNVVTERLGQFLNDSQRNLLVLSFQGWTGIGKNYMSNILARFVPSRNVHRYIVTLHFASNSKFDIRNWIGSEVTATCGLHLFVVDEMDKASDILVSHLHKALHSAREFLTNQLHTKTIVLLLSNTGSTAINAYTAEVLEEGVSRENIAYNSLADRLGMVKQAWYSEMLREKLLDQIVPFLPLEKMHVEKCAATALESRQAEVKHEIISAVLNRLSFFPLSKSIFSTSGCRKVNAELDLLLY